MKKLILTLLFVALSVFSVYSQGIQPEAVNQKSNKFLVGKFWDNWFISAGGGVNLYIGAYNQNLGEHLTPAIDFSVGKWVTPSFGLRLQYNGVSMSTTADKNYWYADKNTKGLTKIEFDYQALHGDLLLNLSSAIGGYKPGRLYQLISFVGFGWSQSSMDEKARNEFFAIAGLKNNFRISNSFDVHCELSAVAVSQQLAGHLTGAKPNFPLAATAGVTYHFGGRKARRFKTDQSAAARRDLAQLNTRFNTLTETNSRLQTENEALAKQQAALAAQMHALEKPTPATEKPIAKVAVPIPVFFNINEHKLSKRSIASLKYLAAHIKENPNRKFTIKGYADSQTGNPTFNQNLSDKRAEAIKTALVKIYGVDSRQLQAIGQGGVESLFDHSYLNRAAIILSE